MSKALERRAKLREALIEAAERAISTRGLGGLKTRELAQEIGIANGGVYNLVEDVDELILHQVPVLLGGGRPFFQELPQHIQLNLVEAVPAPGVTHLRYEVQK